MKEESWNAIFKAMYYIAVVPLILYYFMPDLIYLFDETTGKPTPICLAIIIYFLVLVILLLLHYYYYKKTSAEVVGLWSIAPQTVGGTVLLDGKTSKQNGTINLLTDSDATSFLAETFSFSFFVSVDKSSIEMIPGENLTYKDGLYQKIIVVPGAYSISIDPIHENMSIVFDSYKTTPYRVNIPTLSVQRWHQILVSIEGRVADIYQNGALIKSVPLPNVISSKPGNPYAIMNSNMYAKLALIQVWPERVIEDAVADNYRTKTDAVGTPTLPDSSNIFGIPNFDFCIGQSCFGPAQTKETALTTVEYTYA
jgi:hypothetical protein